MKYISILLILLSNFCFSQNKTFHDAGIYTNLDWSKNENIQIIPQIWTYINKFYLEGRYNYENINTFSLYVGRSISYNNKVYFDFIPMIGGVIGKTNGISPGFNFQLDYKNFSTFTEFQYTIDLKNTYNSFFWDWTRFSFNIFKYVNIGGAIQILDEDIGNLSFKVGPMIGFIYKKFEFEFYTYNFWERYPTLSCGVKYILK